MQRQGSIAFARWLADDDVEVRAMINLDTIGNIHDFNGNSEDRYLRVYSQGPNDALGFAAAGAGSQLPQPQLQSADRPARDGRG